MTPPKPSQPRQAAHRQRLRAAGLVPVEVWVRPDRRPAVMALDQRREIKPKD